MTEHRKHRIAVIPGDGIGNEVVPEGVRALVKLPNFIATPHSGASTNEALGRSNVLAARSVVAVLDVGMPVADGVVVDGRTQATADARIQ